MSYDKPLKITLLIGELAELTKVSRDTLRYYERKGVLTRPARSSKGYRLYPANAVERVHLVRRALAVGFTLDELSSILAEREQGRAPCRHVRSLAVSKLEIVKERLKELELLRGDLETLVRDWDILLAENGDNAPSLLLETITTGSPGNNSKNRTNQASENFRRRANKGNK